MNAPSHYSVVLVVRIRVTKPGCHGRTILRVLPTLGESPDASVSLNILPLPPLQAWQVLRSEKYLSPPERRAA